MELNIRLKTAVERTRYMKKINRNLNSRTKRYNKNKTDLERFGILSV